jgi:chromosome partitioning protein
MIVIAVANQKGGVGKTTITRELSDCCAMRGYQVLAIDCDSQGSLTRSWIEMQLDWLTLSNVLIEPESAGYRAKPRPLPEAVLQSPLENLDLVASDIRLQRFELQQDYMTPRLRNQIREHCQDYDLVFIDCPPQLGKLLIAAFNASDYILIPCEADVVGLTGIPDLDYTIEQGRGNMNPQLERLGAVMNKYKPNHNLSFNARNEVEAASEMVGPIFDTNIHEYSKITEAPSAQMAVVQFAPNHRAAEQFWNFTDEVLDQLQVSRNKIAAVK